MRGGTSITCICTVRLKFLKLTLNIYTARTYFYLSMSNVYSRTSNKGPSMKGTTSLQGALPISPKWRVYAIHFNWKEDSLPTRDKMTGPKLSFTRKFHCTVYSSYFSFSVLHFPGSGGLWRKALYLYMYMRACYTHHLLGWITNDLLVLVRCSSTLIG